MRKSRPFLLTVTLLPIAIIVALISLYSEDIKTLFNKESTEQVIDKKESSKGTTVRLKLKPNEDENGSPLPIRPEDIEAARQALSERLDRYGNINAEISKSANKGLILVIPKIPPERAKEIIKQLTTTAKLTVHAAHPLHNTTPTAAFALAKKVADREEIVPSYRAYPELKKDQDGHLVKDKDGNVTAEKYWLVKRSVAVSGADIEYATPSTVHPDRVQIKLTDHGADAMKTFTQNLDQGEYIITILDGRVVSAAVLNARWLGKHFVITGLKSRKESEDLARALNVPLENNLEVISEEE